MPERRGQLGRRTAGSPKLQPEQPSRLRRARERAGANGGPRFCSSARRSRAGPWPRAACLPGTSRQARSALQPGRGGPDCFFKAGKEIRGPGSWVQSRPCFSEAAPATSDSGRWLRARPGKGVGCAGRGPGSASRGGARGARFPDLAARPTARLQLGAPVCYLDVPGTQTFPSIHVELLPGGAAPEPRPRTLPPRLRARAG